NAHATHLFLCYAVVFYSSFFFFFFSSRRRHTRSKRDWSSDVCSSDLLTHCPSSRSKTAFLRFAGITGSPALVISSNHLGMTFNPLSKIVSAILLAPALPAQCTRFRRLQVVPVPLEDTLEVRDELLFETRRHPVD